VHVLAEADVADELIGVHAGEDELDALLGARLPRIHDLERLLALAFESGSPRPASVADAGWLTPSGVQFRYDEAVELLDQEGALAVCDAALGWAIEAFG
jgi:hypothetical protein